MYILSLLCIFLLEARSAQPLEALILEKWVVKNYPFQGATRSRSQTFWADVRSLELESSLSASYFNLRLTKNLTDCNCGFAIAESVSDIYIFIRARILKLFRDSSSPSKGGVCSPILISPTYIIFLAKLQQLDVLAELRSTRWCHWMEAQSNCERRGHRRHCRDEGRRFPERHPPASQTPNHQISGAILQRKRKAGG